MTPRIDYTIVVPTVGRPNLVALVEAVGGAGEAAASEIIVVDDRPAPLQPLSLPTVETPVRVLFSGGRGPAAARNVGWRSASSPWIVFLDDDVAPATDWHRRLVTDLNTLGPADAGSQATLVVPLPVGRRPTDVERGTVALASARWITADMAYRRDVLAQVDGFDERFSRAYREDADLALRICGRGYRIVRGQRVTNHPPAIGTVFTSVRAQRGNRDNALMRRKHGPRWRQRIGEGRGRMREHAATTAAGIAAIALAANGRRRAAAAAGGIWLACVGDFAARRIAAGPIHPREVATMLLTSVAIPPIACAERLRGEWQARRGRGPRPMGRPRAFLFDRDGTLIVDLPYLCEPERVQPVTGARRALDGLRQQGIPIGVVSNQSGIARGLLTHAQLDLVNRRIEDLLGPFDTWQVCVHGPDDECECRKPKPGLVHAAARDLGVAPTECVVIGDIGADVDAAHAAGARAILVPTDRTRADEVERARQTALVAPDLVSAVELALVGAR